MSKTTMFDKIYGKTKEALDAAKKPFAKNSLVLTIDGAINNADIQIVEATDAREKALIDVIQGTGDKKESVRKAVEASARIRAAVQAKTDLTALKNDLFAETDAE